MLIGRLLSVLATAAVATIAPATAANAGDPVDFDSTDGQHASVTVNPVVPGAPGGSSTSGASTAAKSSKCKRADGAEVSCHLGGATWWASQGCYVELADPQPTADDPIWSGHREGGETAGKIYRCITAGGGRLGVGSPGYVFWAAANPVAGGGVDPADLADEAVEKMHLRAVRVGLTPPPETNSYTLVGIPTWMWVSEPDPRTWGPISESASAGGVTVTATAHVRLVRWDMGDGTTVNCGEGTPYLPAFDADPSPTCGHRYREPGRYQVSATSDWQVDWDGAGQSGVITFSLHNDAQVWVREAFALVTRNG